MPAYEQPPDETQTELLAEQAAAPPEGARAAPIDSDLTQRELLAQITARQAASRKTNWLGKLAFWNHKNLPREPRPDDISRRETFRQGAAAGVVGFAALYGISHFGQIMQGIGRLWHKGREIGRLLTFQQEFDAYIDALPSDNAIERDIPNLGRVIDLDTWREQRGIKGPVNIFIINVGTSNSFAYGTDDLHHPRQQKHAAVYRAAEALKDAARRLLGIGEIKTLVLARPGAYSGYQFPGITDEDQPRDGILEQLEDAQIQEFIDEAGPDDIIIVRYEGGFDDLRLLADNIDQIEATLAKLEEALDSDEPVSDEIRAEFQAFKAKLNQIAAGYNQNFQQAAARVAQYSAARMAKQYVVNGVVKHGAPILFEPVYTWSLFTQARVPFGLLKKQAADAPVPRWLKLDLTDFNPNILRYFIEISAIREGNKLARMAWVCLCLAQTAALKQAMLDHPELEVFPESLIGVNTEGFYAALVKDLVTDLYIRDEKGDGHPGMLEDAASGIDFVAARFLQIWRAYVAGRGKVSADDYAEFNYRSRQKPS